MKKESKALARYQSAPKGTQRCGNCSMFVDGGTCTKVNGDISPYGWCIHWYPNDGKMMQHEKAA